MKIPILISFAYWNDDLYAIIEKYKNEIDIIIDSGAYTAFTKGKKIDLNDYVSFIKELPKDWEYRYFTLDVIGDAKNTYWNYKALLNKGLKPIPIFTRGENLKRIDEYYKYDELLALGGISVASLNIPGYVKYIMDKGIKGRKIHWLGWSEKDFILYYKPYSFDSTGWTWGGRYGDIAYLKYNQRCYFRHQERAAGRKVPEEVKKLINRVIEDPKDIGKMSNWEKKDSIPHLANTITYLEHAELLIKKIGTKAYFAVGDSQSIEFILKVYHKYVKENI